MRLLRQRGGSRHQQLQQAASELMEMKEADNAAIRLLWKCSWLLLARGRQRHGSGAEEEEEEVNHYHCSHCTAAATTPRQMGLLCQMFLRGESAFCAGGPLLLPRIGAQTKIEFSLPLEWGE